MKNFASSHSSRDVHAENLTIRKSGREILNHVSMKGVAGGITMILGPNGAGKSTLLRALAGLERAEAGRVTWGQDAIAAWDLKERAKILAYAPASHEVPFAYTVAEVVLMGRFAHHGDRPCHQDKAAADKAICDMRLDSLSRTPVTQLSSGERQRVHLARVLAADCPVILLDEPTAHLDLAQALHVLAILRDRAATGSTVVITHHDLHTVEPWASHVVLLSEGHMLVEGPPEISFVTDTVSNVFGLEMTGTAHSRIFTLRVD